MVSFVSECSLDTTAALDGKVVSTFGQFVRGAAAAFADEIAVTFQSEAGPDDTICFSELERRSAELAKGLIARCVGKGSRVGFIQGNGPSFAVTLAAIARIGAIAVPISTMIRADELVRVLRQSDISGLIVQRRLLGYDLVERLCDALPELAGQDAGNLRLDRTPFLRWIVSTGDELPAGVNAMAHLTALAGTVNENMLIAIEAEVHPSEQMIEIYTSGSMALPKGVKHSHGAVLFRARYLADMLALGPGQSTSAALPMFWVGGLLMALLPAWWAGSNTYCTERTLSNSRMAMGTVMADEDLERMARATGPKWALGMSETLGPYCFGDELRAEGYPLCTPIDHVADGYEIRVVDTKEHPVPDGGTGEIQVRGYPVAMGLHKIGRDQLFTSDGFYRTGDLGKREGTRVHFVGRDGDMIKTAGSNVSPAEVEMEMQQLDEIESAYVIGLPDRERGQLVAAAIVAKDGAFLDFKEIEAKLRERLSPYKVPRAYLALTREEVPLLHSNKVARRQIHAMMAAALGRD